MGKKLEMNNQPFSQTKEVREKKKEKVQKLRLPKRPVTPPDKITYILAMGLSLALSLGLTLMFQSTYSEELDLNIWILALGMPLYAALATLANAQKKIRYSMILLAVNVVVSGLFYYFDVANTQTGFWHIMTVLYKNTFRSLSLPMLVYRATGYADTVVFLLLAIWPIFFTTFMILRRRSFMYVFVCCIPYVLCTIALDYMFPSTTSCVLTIGSIILLLCFNNLRKMNGGQKDRTILKLAVPVFSVLIAIGLIFPQSTYNKNELAEKEKAFFTSVAAKAAKLNTYLPSSVRELFVKKKTKEPESWTGNAVIKDLAQKIVVMNDGTEDLSLVGSFDPPEVEVFQVERFRNVDYEGTIEPSRYLYLKSSSMGEFKNNKWSADDIDLDPEEIYLNENLPEVREAKYILKVDMTASAKRRVVPYYTDNYQAGGAMRQVYEEVPVQRMGIIQEYGLDGAGDEYYFAYSNIPVRVGRAWSDEYLDLVYDRYLRVPERTQTAVSTSGVLPQWYYQCMLDPNYLSTEEKVDRVVELVSGLHPYDASTPYCPDGEDFVGWFLKEAETGFCVHYATTAAVMLRLVGVPTRYVNGYMVNDFGDQQATKVYTTDSHAWFEFFTEEYGWVMCDPTPGNATAMSGFGLARVKEESEMAMPITPDPATESRSGRAIIETQPTTASSTTSEGEDTYTSETTSRYPVSSSQNADWDNIHLEFASETAELPSWAKVILSCLGVIVFLLLLRLGYILWWKSRLSSGSTNKRAHAFYRYMRLSLIPYRKRPSRKIVSIAQKAAFSAEGISEEELKSMFGIGRKMLHVEGAKSSGLRRFLCKHLIQIEI